ncbi:1-aminocyclopropane-1-carboxylate deaminase/D-cysteine desulfhydrase [Caldalkalibacillus mannanilyticus]|uniref:1-aminocyclopropane-1-carboxylate deaminase/D-cysteine desulfhydrase n=1 Tax=Caldalkalibacillus mannanilyticus TaxID=1418 RepID=UPI0022773834|nr:pyridoxal-phosphate dependent enzyme [Caldalkalibacillus mannanilyticus]
MDPGHRKANLFLDQLVGAEICFSGAYTPKQMEKALDNAYSEWKERGRNPYIVPIGGSNGLGTLGYVDAYQELGEHDFDWIVVTAGSGGTYAGLALGVLLDQHNKQTKLLGFSPWLEKQEIEKRVHQCMEQASELLPAEQKETIVALSFDRHERLLLDDQYIGSGYGRITPEASEAIRLFAQKEAILLDQVYTGKAMAGMLDYIQKGIIQPKEKVLFWHTGGAPGLFALDQI